METKSKFSTVEEPFGCMALLLSHVKIARRIHTLTRNVYADYAATTPLCLPARRAMHDAFDIYGNPSSLHYAGAEARKLVEKARSKVAKAINAEPDEIYFTSGATEANIWVLSAFSTVKSNVEHSSMEYGRRGGIVGLESDHLGMVPSKPVIDLKFIDTMSVLWVNNEIGTVQDMKSLASWATNSADKLFHTDATQAVGHISVDVRETGVDLLSMSAHKFGGPKGIGALFVRRGVDILPMLHGGHQEAGKRAGTENVIGIAGMGEAIEWATNNLDKSVPYLTKLRDILIDGILSIPGTKLTGHPTQRSPSIASFVFSDIDGQPLVLALDKRGVYASSGSACSEGQVSTSHVLKAMGYTEETGRGSLRLSIGWETTEADVRYIIRAVKESVEELRN